MIPAITLMCALSAPSCHSSDARAIAKAIDMAAPDDRLRAVMVVYSWAESRWTLRPDPVAPDALDGRSCGAWQMPCAIVHRLTLEAQARTWLRWVHASSLAAVDSSARRAWRRARVAERLLSLVR